MQNKKLRNTLIASGLFLAGCYSFVFYSYKYGYLYNYLPYFLMFFSFVWLTTIWTVKVNTPKWKEIIKSLAMLLAMGLIFYGLLGLQDKYFDYQLNQFGIITYARVIGEKQQRVKGTTYYNVIISYKCNEKEYLQTLSNNNRFYQSGDTVSILCSTRNPDILKVIGNKLMSH